MRSYLPAERLHPHLGHAPGHDVARHPTRFTDPATGRETRPASCPHQLSDYVMAAIDAGLRINHLSEHAVDEALARTSPRAVKYLRLADVVDDADAPAKAVDGQM